MANIHEDKQAPIVSNILQKGFIPTPHEAARHIIQSEDRHRTDALNAIVSGGVSAISGAICLSLSPMLLPMPLLATVVCGATWYNSRVRQQRREQEMEFIKRHKEVFAAIDVAESQGAMPEALEAGYKSAFRAYLDDELGRTPQLTPYFEDMPLRLRDIPIDDSPIPTSGTLANTKVDYTPTEFPVDAISRVVGNTANVATSASIAPPAPEPEIIAHTPSVYTRSLFNMLADNPFLCYYIVASQRTGKTTSAAAASLQAKREFGTAVYYINLNDHNQGNREAFAHADRVCVGNISGGNPNDRKSLVNDAILLIEEFHQSNNAILVIDEWMALGAKGKALLDGFWAVLADKAEALASNGVGCGRAIWALAPYFKAENIRSEAKCVKNYIPYVLAIAPDQEVVWRNPNNGAAVKLTHRGEVIGQIKNNWPDVSIAAPTADEIRQWKRNGISRIFWADGEWSGLEPAPTMPSPQAKKPEPPTIECDAIAHCGKKLWEVIEQRIAAGDRAALVAGELIIEQAKTDRLKAIATAIHCVAPTKAEFDRICGGEYGAIFEELMGVRL